MNECGAVGRVTLRAALQRFAMVAAVLALSACAAMRGDLAAPGVALAGLRLGHGDGIYQKVFVDLVITNPNDVPLKFNAISYRVRVEGYELADGSSREPLEVAARGSKKYTVPVTVNLLDSFGLIRDLTTQPKNKIAYELSATLEPSGLFSLPVTVRKTDTLSLR